MISALVIRQFHSAGDPVTVTLCQELSFDELPTLGSLVEVPGVSRPLTVFSITYRPYWLLSGAPPATAELFLEWEDLDAADVARERGWAPIE